MVAWCGAVLGELHATFAESSPGGTHALPLVAPPVAQPVAPPVAQPLARQWRASGLTRWIPSPQTTCPSPTVTDQGTTHRHAMKQAPPTPIIPHQQAENSPHNQHVVSILQVGSHHLQYRFFRTKKPKSHHKTNTFCSITQTRTDPGARTRAGGTGTHEAPGFQWNPGAGSGDGGI